MVFLCNTNKVYLAAVAILVTSLKLLPDVLSGIVRLRDTIIQYYDYPKPGYLNNRYVLGGRFLPRGSNMFIVVNTSTGLINYHPL